MKHIHLTPWDVTKTGNGERETGNECTLVIRPIIQIGGKGKKKALVTSFEHALFECHPIGEANSMDGMQIISGTKYRR